MSQPPETELHFRAGKTEIIPSFSFNWLVGWASLLATVFLSSATLNSLMRWLPYSHAWDLGGTIISGVMAWFCYTLTLSIKSSPKPEKRLAIALALPLLWCLLFPTAMWTLGFK